MRWFRRKEQPTQVIPTPASPVGINPAPAHVTPVTVSAERMIARVRSVRGALERGNGSPERLARLRAELDSLLKSLADHQKAVAALLE